MPTNNSTVRPKASHIPILLWNVYHQLQWSWENVSVVEEGGVGAQRFDQI